MATLEKIRSQQKLLFTIVIIALFLFIISIASADSIRRLFGPGTTIAQVGGQKIDYEDYRQANERLNQQQQQQKVDREEQSQQTIQQLLQDAMIQEQFDKLGIRVTDAEISRAMTGSNPHAAAMRFIQTAAQYLQLPTADGNVVLDAIKNPGRYNLSQEQLNQLAQYVFGTPTMADAWAMTEKNVETAIQQRALGSLLSGLFVANELDAKSMYNDNNTETRLSYVTVPYSSIPSDGIEINDADLKAQYELIKPVYRLDEETREIDYIIVPIVPSKEDYDAAELEVDQLVEALRTQPGVEGAVVSSKFVQDHKTIPVADIKRDRDLALIPDSMMSADKVYKYRRSGDNFRVAKVLNVSSQIDSINVSVFIAADAVQADSIKGVLDAGTSFKDLAAKYERQAADSLWQSLVGAPDNLVTVFQNAALGQSFVYTDSLQGSNAVYRVNSRKAAKPYADVVLFSYIVDPSASTVSDIKTQLSGFLASNSKGDAFSANADSLYTLRHTTVTGSTPKLGYSRPGTGFADTRHAIKWAMDAKKGQVSPIFEDSRDFYVVVAVKDIFNGDYVPYNASFLKDDLTTMAIASKKGDKLIEQYQGKAKDLAGYAQLMGTEVRTDSTIVFTSPRLATLGAGEYALQGQIAGAAKGTVVGPVKGTNEVMVFVVDDTQLQARPYDYQQDGMNFMNTFGISNLFKILQGNREVKNNSLKFENYSK